MMNDNGEYFGFKSAYILKQDSLPTSYKSFLNKHGGKDPVILQGVKDIASGKPFTNLGAIEKYYKTMVQNLIITGLANGLVEFPRVLDGARNLLLRRMQKNTKNHHQYVANNLLLRKEASTAALGTFHGSNRHLR
ncbi:hypothetical protein JHK82_024320 [Glycine max]|nr:hypothetical protein JHK85_024903 [Glycine max]KAG5012153.1 hypothetical protein JHK86_024414 [Glycine max]KAG5133132.1 hypothetical protein JHK82_024320 [Glycine max]